MDVPNAGNAGAIACGISRLDPLRGRGGRSKSLCDLSNPRGFSLPSLSARPKKSPALRGSFLVWRRERDSNPRYAINVYSLSRGALSTTQPSLRNQSYHYSQPADESGICEAISCNKARYSPHRETSTRLRLCSPILPILSALLLPQL